MCQLPDCSTGFFGTLKSALYLPGASTAQADQIIISGSVNTFKYHRHSQSF